MHGAPKEVYTSEKTDISEQLVTLLLFRFYPSVTSVIVCIAEKYDYVGRLLKPGEEPTNYSDEEEEGSQQEGSQQENAEKSKDE